MAAWIHLLLVVCGLQILVNAENARLRQVHNTGAHSTNPASTATPTDTLATWMTATATTKPNVLFLIADDLRPKLGCYGDPHMITPNLDFLSKKSVRFDNAYAQVALCSPSRTSFLTGRRAETTRVHNLQDYFRTVAGNFTTLPEYFKQHGYFSQGVGKIYHPGTASGGNSDYPYSWSERNFDGHDPQNFRQHQVSSIQPVNETKLGKLQDTDIADFAINFLHEAKTRDQPFFLAVGFHKPHLPWTIPEEFMNLYPQRNLHLAAHRTKPPTVPDIAWKNGGEIRVYGDIKALNASGVGDIIPDFHQFKMIQAYSAAVSYMDAQVGRVLDALRVNGFAQNTIISFLGDHGWQLGENAEWTKHTNYELATRIPMMLYVPEVTSHGQGFTFIDALAPDYNGSDCYGGSMHVSSEFVEAVDLFPTIAELAGLPVPPTCPENSLKVDVCVEGTSLVPLVRKMRGLPGGDGFQWKDAAFSTFLRNEHATHPVLGVSMRTGTVRYTEWVYYDPVHGTDFSHVVARELYLHDTDPEEFTNVVDDASQATLVQQLSHKLQQGWRKALQDYIATTHH